MRAAATPRQRSVPGRLVALALLVVLLVLATTFAPSGTPGPAPAHAGSGDVGQYLGLLNQARARAGVAPLTLDGELSGTAQGWAGQLASWGRLQHASDLSIGVSQPWVKLGENVGRGPSTGVIFDAFLASPTHYRNIVDGSFTRVGIGVVWSGDTQYVTHRFLAPGGGRPPAPPPPPPPPSPPPSPSPATGGESNGGSGAGTTASAGAPATAEEPPPPPPPGPGDPVRAASVLDALRALDGSAARLGR
ncbi:CAP domain-containing protein [Rhabdothermincola salaria]|uniref:CAP domain-containing protein n=1 Tax=Rhabdothermincola salaria TaxID=2903142 RepID=UPI0024B5FF1B|nr:CAP domain-containing protein [Rhabdothermincola salaria]